jgi:hypothetical protein
MSRHRQLLPSLRHPEFFAKGVQSALASLATATGATGALEVFDSVTRMLCPVRGQRAAARLARAAFHHPAEVTALQSAFAVERARLADVANRSTTDWLLIYGNDTAADWIETAERIEQDGGPRNTESQRKALRVAGVALRRRIESVEQRWEQD